MCALHHLNSDTLGVNECSLIKTGMLLSLGKQISALLVAGQPEDWGLRVDGSHAIAKLLCSFSSPPPINHLSLL